MKVAMPYQLAQANIARVRAPLDDPSMQEFVAQLNAVNAVADRSTGFVWRLKTEAGDATGIRAYDDDRILFNMSVWESLEALHDYVYQSEHLRPLRARRQWFDPMPGPSLVLWWVPAGHVPSIEEAKARFALLEANGPCPDAFTFRQPFPPPGQALQARPELDAEFCEPHRPESPLLRASTLAALLLVIATTIGCDRVTKHVAETTLVGQPIQSYFADTVRLQWTQNPGAFLGLGADWPEGLRTALFTGGNAVLLTMLIVAAVRLRWSGPALLGLAFFVAGGASNLADRLARGTVTDFINVGVGPLRTGIFNVADVAIMLGAALVAFGSFRSRDHH
jgi:lipoprotein signal peptidase